MTGSRPRHRTALLIAVPLGYATLLSFHPVLHDGPVAPGVRHALTTWNVVHVAQLAFVGAMGAALIGLVHGIPDRVATLARASALLFVLVYGAYETWTGIATGALVSAAQSLPAAQQETASFLIQTHWESHLLGNGSAGAIIGSAAWLVGTIAAALALRRAGAPVGAVAALAGCGLLFAPTHVPPFGPAAMVLFAGAAVGLQVGGWSRPETATPDPPG